ncbi:MAG TPA: phosphatase PAP2 family protein [Polyangiaceae bacterium]|nr:phosphatase PAP2 family protein [Polyangiaceae bacterium]
MRRLAIASSFALALSTATVAASAEPAFDTSWTTDGAITAGSFTTLVLLNLALDKQAPPPACASRPCGPLGDGARPYDRGWDLATYGTALLAVGGAMTPSSSRWAAGDGSGADTARSSLVLAEAIGVTLAVTELTKIAVPRYRPFLAFEPRPGASRVSQDASASFWSGHSALTFAAAAIGAFDACRVDSPVGCAAPAIGLHAFAAATAWGRVMAGKHHASDVLVGAAVGSGLGALVAMLHAPDGRERGRGAGQALAGSQVFMLGASWVF